MNRALFAVDSFFQFNANVDLEKLLKDHVGDSAHILDKYTFKNSAKIVWDDIQQIISGN